MNDKILLSLTLLCLTALFGCAQTNPASELTSQKKRIELPQSYEYVGWYCPDNLNNFPAVSIKNWQKVPVVEGRLPTETETKSEHALILVDQDKYPEAKAMDINLPKLAYFYNDHSKKKEVVIVIQAVEFPNDSIVGFRYLNGGNGTAYFKEVQFLSEKEIANIPKSKFVTFSINIKSPKDKIWEVLTKPAYAKKLQPIFDKDNTLSADWFNSSKVNYQYIQAGENMADFADDLYGNMYIQIDRNFSKGAYVEKFFLSENPKTKVTEMKIVCGPFESDYTEQHAILNTWSAKVKDLSEGLASLYPKY